MTYKAKFWKDGKVFSDEYIDYRSLVKAMQTFKNLYGEPDIVNIVKVQKEKE